jgi:hypothetical protein
MSEYTFLEAFGLEFGAGGNEVFSYNDSGEFTILFTTPSHTEDSITFSFTQGTFITGMAQPGKQYIEVFDNNGVLVAKDLRRLDFFVNEDGTPPDAAGSTHKFGAGFTHTDRFWLKPNTGYRLVATREFWRPTAQSWSVRYVGHDGGEQPIESEAAIAMTIEGVPGTWKPEE